MRKNPYFIESQDGGPPVMVYTDEQGVQHFVHGRKVSKEELEKIEKDENERRTK